MRKKYLTVDKAVEAEFENEKLYMDQFEPDITCYSRNGTRCAVVFDGGTVEKEYILIGLEVCHGGQWKVEHFEHVKNKWDGIDAMCNANAFIHNHD